MKIVINALSARIGGGQTYVNQLLRRLPDADDLQIFIYAADSLDIPDHPRITRLQSGLRSENPVLRTLWEKYVLPRKLRQLNPDIFSALAACWQRRCLSVVVPSPCLEIWCLSTIWLKSKCPMVCNESGCGCWKK